MTRNATVVLTGLARGGELRAAVVLTTIRPRCLEYSEATVTVEIDGRELTCRVVELTDETALSSIAAWLTKTVGAKVASIVLDDVHAAA